MRNWNGSQTIPQEMESFQYMLHYASQAADALLWDIFRKRNCVCRRGAMGWAGTEVG